MKHRTSIRSSLSIVAAGLLWAGCSGSASSPASHDVAPTDPPPAPTTSTEGGPGDSGGGGSDGDAADASTTDPAAIGSAVAAFDAALAAAVCQRLATCCSPADTAAFFQQYTSAPYDLKATPSAAECTTSLTTQLGKLHQKWAASATNGRMAFVPARAQACVAGVSNASCGAPLTSALFDAACFGSRGNEVFIKLTPTGAACSDIKDGTFYGECDPKLGFCGSSAKCEPWRKTGESCGVVPTRMFCAPSLSCEGGSGTAPGTCSAAPIMRKLGEGCGAATGPLELCAVGTYCDGDTELCTATKPDGAACKYDEECQTNRPYSCSPFGGGTCGSDTYCASGP
jgi:hypothetical protein